MLAMDALGGATWREMVAAARSSWGVKTRTPLVVVSTIACIESSCADPVQDIALPDDRNGQATKWRRTYAEGGGVVKRLPLGAPARLPARRAGSSAACLGRRAEGRTWHSGRWFPATARGTWQAHRPGCRRCRPHRGARRSPAARAERRT